MSELTLLQRAEIARRKARSVADDTYGDAGAWSPIERENFIFLRDEMTVLADAVLVLATLVASMVAVGDE